MAFYQLGEYRPQIAPTAYVFDNATVIGQVILHEHASIWPHVTLRGDNEPISIGVGSNVQESSVLHTDLGCPLTVGDHVTIGHQAMLHGCTIESGSLIGMQAVVLNRAHIGKNCLIAAGALITEGKIIPDNSLVIGSPGKVIRQLTPDEIATMHSNTSNYIQKADYFRTHLTRIND